jgi:predicted nucleotidyltransferase
MLEMIIASKARASILNLFFLNEENKYHIRELSRLLKINVNQARQELIKLTNAGLLKCEKAGNVHLYSIDISYIFYNELSSIAKKSTGFEKILEKKLSSIARVRYAFIFGSYAAGKFGPRSDIDIMIIGRPDMLALNETINSIEKRIERSIQYIVYPLSEFKKKRNYGFVKNVINEKKIFLIGDPNELKRA